MAASAPTLPPSLKSLKHYIKTASEHDKRDPVVAYYCRLYTLQKAMEIDKKSPEARGFLMSMMDLLEKSKKELADNEAITSEMVGQAHVENYALKLFLYADNEDRAGRFGKNVVKSFYTAGVVMDVLQNFGELSEDIEKNRKYAKWKAAYIHTCLKNGETPHAGPLEEGGGDQYPDDDLEASGFDAMKPAPSASASYPPPPSQPSAPQPPAGGASYPHNQPTSQYPPAQPTSQYPPAQPSVPSSSGSYGSLGGGAGAAGGAMAGAAASAPAGGWTPPANTSGARLTATEYQRGMKLCKYAMSAMQYEDTPTAIDNLVKALNLMTKGKE